jgi:hypothetical protein
VGSTLEFALRASSTASYHSCLVDDVGELRWRSTIVTPASEEEATPWMALCDAPSPCVATHGFTFFSQRSPPPHRPALTASAPYGMKAREDEEWGVKRAMNSLLSL